MIALTELIFTDEAGRPGSMVIFCVAQILSRSRLFPSHRPEGLASQCLLHVQFQLSGCAALAHLATLYSAQEGAIHWLRQRRAGAGPDQAWPQRSWVGHLF